MAGEYFVSNLIARFEENGERCELVQMPHVCIIESPSAEDRKAKRREGVALCEILKQGDIRHKRFDVKSREELQDAFDEIEAFAAPRKLKKRRGKPRQCVAPRLFLHFSCHGNEEGISLTNDDFVEWPDLSLMILDMAQEIGLFRPKELSFACLTLCMSSCCGLHAQKMANNSEAVPFLALVGCKEEVDWSDGVTAFGTLYHQAILKGRTIPKAVEGTNHASLVRDAFELVTARDVGAVGFADGTLVVLMSRAPNGKLVWAYDKRTQMPHIPCVWRKDQVCDPKTLEPILDSVTGGTLEYFDDPEDALAFLQANKGRRCQVERCAAEEINIRFAHKF